MILPLVALLTLMTAIQCTPRKAAEKERQIRHAVERQMRNYPLSTLRDIYKNFFLDNFGAGHVIVDTAVVARNLRHELDTITSFEGKRYELFGHKENFYRVNLSVLRDTLVDFNIFFNAFVRSVNNFDPPSHKEWVDEWLAIEKIIIKLGLDTLPNFEEDRQAIRDLFGHSGFTMKHSKAYDEAYNSHYCIIQKEIFQKEVLPQIKKRMKR